MTIQKHTALATPTHGHARPPLAVPNPAVMAEVERLLAGRTRSVRLTGEIHRLFRERSWPQTATIIRSWMKWVAILAMLTLVLSLLTLPEAISASMILPATILPPVAIAVLLLWRQPRALWLQQLSLVGGMALILLSIALAGVSAGGEFYERHLNIMLFVAITGIIIFSVPLAWTVTIAAIAMGIYVFFQFQNPGIALSSAVDGALFFASGIIATVVARRTMTLLAQKAFLLELRDRKRVEDLAEANDRLEQLARTDPLTGAANRRWMKEILDDIWVGHESAPAAVALLMCDLDDFKNLNDHLGHAEGDRCLVAVSAIIQGCLRRGNDHLARYGGEEFLVVLPGAGERGALAAAKRIRLAVEAAALPNPTSQTSPFVTVSIGLAVKVPGADISPEKLQNQADAALYQAKLAGRNRVVLHGSGDTDLIPSRDGVSAPPAASPPHSRAPSLAPANLASRTP